MQTRVNIILLLCCLAVCLVVSGCRHPLEQPLEQPLSRDGVMDLRDWDFKEKGAIRLDGQWAFYWNRLVSPKALAVGKGTGSKAFLEVPGAWNNFKHQGRAVDGAGAATYHLRVLLGPGEQDLGLKLLDAATAFAVYVNGVRVGGGGTPGLTPGTSRPLYRPAVVSIGSHSNVMDIVVHVSNFHHWQGGMWEPVLLGRISDVIRAREKKLAFSLFLFGAIVIMGLYHLVLFMGRKENRSPLYFALFNFAIAIRLMATGERFWVSLATGPGFRAELLLVYISFFLCMPFFVLYVHALFPKEVPRPVVRLSIFAGVLFSLFALVMPIPVHTRTILPFQALTLGVVGVGGWTSCLAIVRKRQGAVIFFTGFFILGLAVVNDVFHARQFISTGYYVPFGLFCFIFSQAFLLSQRFSRAFSLVEAQWKELDRANQAYQGELAGRIKAEEGLKASEAQYRRLIERSADGICIIRGERVVFANQHLLVLCGMDMAELCGSPFQAMIYPEDREKVLERYRTLEAKGGRPGYFRVRGQDKDGQILFLELTGSLIEWEGENSVMAIVRDVTEQTRTRELLMQSEKMMSVGGLAAGMAHEINNPLSGMIQSAQLISNRLAGKFPGNDRAAVKVGLEMARVSAYARERGILKLLDNIQSAGKSASDIVANMLSFSRKPDQEKAACRLDRVVEKALALAGNDFQLKKQYDFKNIRISTSYEPNLPPIQCEETKIQQVLLNLFKNAAQAMVSQANDNTDPAIEIRLFREKADLCLTVSDNGPGMDESIRKRIFEPFFTTKPVDSGTGLGLSISYFIITEDHGGQMDVRSAPGQGTEFILRLPLD